MAVSRKLKSVYTGFFDGIETWTANRISDFQETKKLGSYMDKRFSLTKEQVREIAEFWKPYGGISPKWCAYYCAQNGIFDPRYIPNTLYFTRIDQHFNARKLGYGFNDKNYYSRIFPDVRQPKTLVRKIGTLLFDGNYFQMDLGKALHAIRTEEEVVIKPTQESGSGRNIAFYHTEKDAEAIETLLKNPAEKNYMVQAVVKQHPALSQIYPNALNTVRVTTLLMEDGVHVLSCVLRMGAGGSRIDNASSGGLSVGMDENGCLKKYGHILYRGTAVDRHPQGFVFEGVPVPEYQNVLDTVKRLAQYTGNFRLVSWDMSIDDQAQPVLIEANMRKGGIAIHQFNNGPLFGNLTRQVLDEVFGK